MSTMTKNLFAENNYAPLRRISVTASPYYLRLGYYAYCVYIDTYLENSMN